jgi:hypothetical protein
MEHGPEPELTHRQLAFQRDQTERLVRATEQQVAFASRTPSELERVALSIASSALAIVLAGVVLIIIADSIDLIRPINRWPLVTLGVCIVAVAAIIWAVGQRGRDHLWRDLTAPWTSGQRLEDLERKIGALEAQQQTPQPPRADAGG